MATSLRRPRRYSADSARPLRSGLTDLTRAPFAGYPVPGCAKDRPNPAAPLNEHVNAGSHVREAYPRAPQQSARARRLAKDSLESFNRKYADDRFARSSAPRQAELTAEAAVAAACAACLARFERHRGRCLFPTR